MNFSRDNDPFSFMNHSNQFSSDQMKQIQDMMNQMNKMMGNDFWSNISGLSRRPKRQSEYTPIEIWEGRDHLFLYVLIPWIQDTNNVRLEFFTDQKLLVKAKVNPIQPHGAHILLHTELPRKTVTKEIHLPTPVIDEQYATTMENGLLLITLEKKEQDHDINIPLQF